MPGKHKRWQELQERRVCAHNRERGLAGTRRGRISEERVGEVLDGLDLPWVLSTRKATKAEDCGGIDFVCELDLGTVYLQVKSSKGGADHFLRKDVVKQLPIAVVIVSDAASQEKLRTQVLHRLALLREELRCGSVEEMLRNRGMIAGLDSALKEAINRYGPITKSLSRVVAGDISVRLRAWVTQTLGLPPSRELGKADDESTVQTEKSS